MLTSDCKKFVVVGAGGSIELGKVGSTNFDWTGRVGLVFNNIFLKLLIR